MVESDKSKGKFTKARFLFFVIFTTKSKKSIVTPYLYLTKTLELKHMVFVYFTTNQNWRFIALPILINTNHLNNLWWTVNLEFNVIPLTALICSLSP